MEPEIQNDILSQETSIEQKPHHTKTKLFFIIGLSLLLLISIPVILRASLQSINQPAKKIVIPKPIPFNTTNSVVSTGANVLLLTDITSKKTVSIAMNSAKNFEVDYGHIDQYNGVFSPDKNAVLFLKDHNIWKVNLQTKNIIQLSTIGRSASGTLWSIDAEFPKWSPDGNVIYYSVNADPPDNTPSTIGMQTPADIKDGTWVMQADGKQQRYLPQIKNPLSWMPDSKTIIFTDQPSDTSATKSYDITTGKTAIFIKAMRIRNIYWSSTGENAVYTKNDLSTSYLINQAGTILDTLSHYEANGSQNNLHTFLISPDGKYIVITKAATTNFEVLLYNTLTKTETQLPITFSQDTKPFWSKDSSLLIYGRDTQKQGDIFTYDLTSRKETQVTNTSTFDPSSVDY